MAYRYPIKLKAGADLKNTVLTHVQRLLQQGKRPADLRVIADIRPKQVPQYVALQEALAQLLPDEFNRPTLMLTVRGAKRGSQHDVPDFGLLGGIGPLSDANMLQRFVKDQADPDHIHLQLLSAPPPRPAERKQGTYLRHLHNYLGAMRAFFKLPHKRAALLSNTAHVNFKMLGAFFAPRNAINLVEKNVLAIKALAPDRVLVLGTLEASKQALYPKAFKQHGIAYTMPVDEENKPSLAAQRSMQAIIDQAKQGNREIAANILLNFIKAQVNTSQPSHIFLSCTELTLLADTKLRNGKSMADTLRTWLDKHHPNTKLLDSESLMINTLNKTANNLLLNLDDTFSKDNFLSLKKRLLAAFPKVAKEKGRVSSLFKKKHDVRIRQVKLALEHARTPEQLQTALQHFFAQGPTSRTGRHLKNAFIEALVDKPMAPHEKMYIVEQLRNRPRQTVAQLRAQTAPARKPPTPRFRA